MTRPETVARLEGAHNALNDARWEEARDAYLAVLAVSRAPEAMDGLGRAQWWLGEAENAIASRVKAYTAYRRSGRLGEAARIAIWLSLEYAAIPGREALAAGWMRRAGRILEATPRSAVHGWLALSRSGADDDPVRVAALAEEALEASRRFGDADLEIRALARLGLAHVSSGRIDEGMALLDEAMAAAAATEGDMPETFAETCCDMVAACEATLDGRRLEQWGKVAERFLEMRPHAPLLSFCGACCAGVFAARGDLGGAERWLSWTIDKLEQGGHESRCVDPKAKLAEIRLEQGRFEEAQRLLVGIERRPEAIRPAVNLHLARGETGAAASLLHRRLGKIGADSVGAIPILGLLVPVQIERGDLTGAAESAAGIAQLAEQTGSDRHRAEGDLAVGRVAMAHGDSPGAVSALSAAFEGFDRARMPLDAARARLDLARALAPDQPELAVVEARAAATAFERAGAMRRADEADALLRALGARGRVGPKGAGRLTKREEEVLQLLAEGLTNVEIGERLFIAPKTVVNHVSNLLMKLNLRSRTEAAGYALRRGPGR